MRVQPLLVLFLAGGVLAAALSDHVLGQIARPPAGGVLDRFLAPPSGVQQSFLGTWNLTWLDPGDTKCPCHGTLEVDTQADGSLKGYWSIRNPPVILLGEVAFDNNVWVGHFAQPDDNVDFPLKGHFRLETRSNGTALTGSYQRDGTTIPRSWSGTRR